jgi:protein SCO1/2
LLIGNEATGQWIRGSALDNPQMTATMISGWVGGYPAAAPMKSYAEAKPYRKFGGGEYLFSTKCSACHSLGDGMKIGPDLAGITKTRDRNWLAKYIADPDEMLKTGDASAKALSAKYKEMRMPNLQLTDQQIAAVIAFLDGIGPARRP